MPLHLCICMGVLVLCCLRLESFSLLFPFTIHRKGTQYNQLDLILVVTYGEGGAGIIYMSCFAQDGSIAHVLAFGATLEH